MNSGEGLRRVSKALKWLGGGWAIAWLMAAAVAGWGHTVTLSVEEQTVMYERQTGKSLAAQVEAELLGQTPEDRLFNEHFGLTKQKILDTHFGANPPTRRENNWSEAVFCAFIGALGFGALSGIAWIVAGFGQDRKAGDES